MSTPSEQPDAALVLPVVDRWFEFRRIDSSITLIWEPHVHDVIRSNIWHVRGQQRSLVVDTGLGIASLVEAAPGMFSDPILAVATHAHHDHVGGLHEFFTRVIHAAELDLDGNTTFASLVLPALGTVDSALASNVLVTAIPYPSFDPRAYSQRPLQPTSCVSEGDTIELGDRTFVVLHLPGHTPGSIGLWDAASGVLFSGDAIYDGQLFDTLPGSSINDYIDTMKRLRELPVSVVHGGHGASFGRSRLLELADDYLSSRRE